MDGSVLRNDLRRLEQKFIASVYGGFGACLLKSANALFHGIICGGSTIVARLADLDAGGAHAKGARERVSRRLGNYDLATPASGWMLGQGAAGVADGTTVAVDFSDISKEFGGKGMEGMAMGWDGSRHTAAMGHTFCAACAVRTGGDTVTPLSFAFERGRKPLAGRLADTLDAVRGATGGKGVFVLDRGGDGDETISLLLCKADRAVVRVNKLDRDVFGTGRDIDKELASLPATTVTLRKPGRTVGARVRWKEGFFGALRLPVLVVESSIGDHALYLYALPGKDAPAADDPCRDAKLSALAARAAQAYLDRWQIEVFFERVKQDFALEDARVRTFKRLRNLFYLCVLGYVFCTRFIPSEAARDRLLKVFKDNFLRVSLKMQVFLSGMRALLDQPRLRFITGRPKKPPDTSQPLFEWAEL